MKNARNRNDLIGTADLQNLFGLTRLLFILACIIFFGVLGATQLDQFDPVARADEIRASNPLLQFIGRPVLVAFAAVFNWHTVRYMLAPTLAIAFVLIAGAMFVKDVYALRSFNDAWHYVSASMFAMSYPVLIIDKGVKQVSPKETHIIDVIGGPGYVLIEPGNAAMFRFLRKPSRVSVTSTYFLAPFETIAQTIYLDDQQGDKDEVPAITRDGIQVTLKDVHFRYRIQQQVRGGLPALKTLHDPYPYSDEAMRNVAFNVTVNKTGLEEWNAAVERIVVGAITDFVAAKKIDDLTAPIGVVKNPRIELRDDFLFKNIQKALGNIGAELLWIDVGHLHIVEELVDEKRTDLWAAEWLGDAEVTRALGEAKRIAYQELGRAEAQAELILSITDSLKESIHDPSSTYNLRKLILVRTAQVLDAMNSKNKNGNNKDEGKHD